MPDNITFAGDADMKKTAMASCSEHVRKHTHIVQTAILYYKRRILKNNGAQRGKSGLLRPAALSRRMS